VNRYVLVDSYKESIKEGVDCEDTLWISITGKIKDIFTLGVQNFMNHLITLF
jgi:hypothetical protein